MYLDLNAKFRAARSRATGPGRLPVSYGRFMQADPIGYEGGMNLYGYVLNDPVNLTDPSGLQDSGQTVVVTGNPLFRPQNAPARNFRNFGPIPSGSLGLQEPDFSSRFGRAEAERLSGDRPAPPCEGDECDNAVVTGIRPTGETRWYFNGRAWVPDPRYERAWWAPYVDYGFVLGPPLAGFVAAATPVAGASLAGRMATSPTLGFSSTRFGNAYYLGQQGTWNYGAVRLGWSYNASTGLMYFQTRIGITHIPTPFVTPPL